MAALLVIFHLVLVVSLVCGHGRMVDPPSRSSMWRFGYGTPKNYNDNELFCGGIGVQWTTNGGRCGVCGDPYNQPQPRDNEAGGKYGKGIIVRNYRKRQIVDMEIEITANHLGFFEFRICPNNNPKRIVSQECLDKYLLTLPDGKSTRFYVRPAYLGPVQVSLKLPENLTCTQCVLQWTYRGENNWGRCADGRQGLGCGPQETFRSCSDVSISDGAVTSSPVATNPSTRRTTTRKPRPSTTRGLRTTVKVTTARPTRKKGQCGALPAKISQVPGLEYWCKSNCAMGHCPKDLCIC